MPLEVRAKKGITGAGLEISHTGDLIIALESFSYTDYRVLILIFLNRRVDP